MVTKREVTEANTETADNHTPTELLELMRLCPVFALLGSTSQYHFAANNSKETEKYQKNEDRDTRYGVYHPFHE